MSRHAGKLALGLVLLGALALCATAQVDSVENLVPTFDDAGRRVNRNAAIVPQTNSGIAIETDVKNSTAANGAPAYPAYFGAGSTPGIYLTNKTNCPAGVVQYRLKVYNRGSVTLKNIKVTAENVLNRAVVKTWTIPEIRSGKSFTLYLKVPFALGQQGINGKVSVVYSGRTLAANNRAHYFGVRPRISLAKSVLNGTQWAPANTEVQAVTVTQDPVFQFQINNTGNFPLTNVLIADAQLGAISISISSWAVNQIATFNLTGMFVAGLSNNSAQVRGTFTNPSFPTRSEQASASDVAWTFGEVDDGPPLNPDLKFTLYALDFVADDFKDANTEAEAVNINENATPFYKVEVQNTGNVDLTDVTFVDSVSGDLLPVTFASLAAGETKSNLFIDDSQSGVGTVFFREAFADARYNGNTQVISNTDAAYYKVVAVPDLPPV